MSDTVLAPPAVDADTAATFVHNSIVVQRGHCFTARLGGTVAAAQDLVPQDEGRACWQSAGVARGHTLIVFCTEVEATDGPPGFGFRVVGSALATFELPGLTFTGLAPLPFAEPDGVAWGTGALLDGDTVYVYGTAAGHAYVARVPFARTTSGQWSFWTGSTWGGRDAIAPMTFAGATPVNPVFVTRSGREYVAVAFPASLPDPKIGGWTSAHPFGPWRSKGVVASATVRAGQFAYDARAIDLGRAGWAVIYNVNDPVAVATDPTVYGGRFVPWATNDVRHRSRR